ncbi:MAG: 16S rRNA (cytosine(1402)-N(4))-methyltransferase [Candidatus Andersenbacteria bacterium CG10_big_fil_rev_8_21_14_0_10_54_11]|uniref:Ribosomal RNA small subunit methyltransferase H n=1 Tax=Candidatus Andersenbacteria bacterium CG10_big_fil_rev_8_21_14_0_10_54_11 TaxID=1974485 RepID=A0A2M6X0B1_9BACT|nr:MAG: 16S rRNA (cytosine(1402)-N(4))-methyltransferase [Candidatus Andersenbacteria bacterium CG10_big_fil_rev_8_21_14_0_10_54_11]
MTHVPVLTAELLEHFKPTPDDTLLDATLGLGGHAESYLIASAPAGRVVGLDADEQSLTLARQRLEKFGERVTFIHANFATLKDSVNGGGILDSPPYTHILFDLGIGSHQIADDDRGFSFRGVGPLTMRYGQPPQVAAQLQPLNWLEKKDGALPDATDIIAGLSIDDLTDLIRTYGEERLAGRIARALKKSPLPITAAQAAERISGAVPRRYEHGRIHPATRTFQALRLAVNRELEALEAALPQAVQLLHPGGQVAVISFHSLEDRIVKNFFRADPDLRAINKKPIVAGRTEREKNPRARSAKLRIAAKAGP